MNLLLVAVLNLGLLVYRFVEKKLHPFKSEIFMEGQLRRWEGNMLISVLSVVIYLAFFPGQLQWNAFRWDKIVFVFLILIFIVAVELLSPAWQLPAFLKKNKNAPLEKEQLQENYYNGFYQFAFYVLQILLLLCPIYVFAMDAMNTSVDNPMELVAGFCLVVAAAISCRQMICILGFVKKGALDENMLQQSLERSRALQRLKTQQKKL